MQILLQVEGLTEAKVRFSVIAKRAADVQPVAPLVAEVMRNAARKTFDLMGEYGEGPAWEPDTMEWMVKKIQRGLDPRTEFATHKLYQSLTTAGVVRSGASYVSLGSNVKYAKYQTRQLVKLAVDDRNEIRQIWFDYIVSPQNRPVGTFSRIRRAFGHE